MKYAAIISSCSDRGLDAIEELPPRVERVLQRVAHARLGRGVGRMADDDVVTYVAVLRIGHLVDVPELDRLAAQSVACLQPASHGPEGSGDLSFRREVDRCSSLDERTLLGRELEPIDQRAGRGQWPTLHHLRPFQADGLAEANEELRVGLVTARHAASLFLVDAFRELHPLGWERTIGVHRAYRARELAHLQEELDGEELELLAAQLAVGQLVPERVTAEGAPRLDARGQIPDEILGSQHLAHRILP